MSGQLTPLPWHLGLSDIQATDFHRRNPPHRALKCGSWQLKYLHPPWCFPIPYKIFSAAAWNSTAIEQNHLNKTLFTPHLQVHKSEPLFFLCLCCGNTTGWLITALVILWLAWTISLHFTSSLCATPPTQHGSFLARLKDRSQPRLWNSQVTDEEGDRILPATKNSSLLIVHDGTYMPDLDTCLLICSCHPLFLNWKNWKT